MPDATQIVDLFHAKQRIAGLPAALPFDVPRRSNHVFVNMVGIPDPESRTRVSITRSLEERWKRAPMKVATQRGTTMEVGRIFTA